MKTMTESIKLVLTHKWFKMIESGQKTEEYRDLGSYYQKRLLNNGHPKSNEVTFYKGYGKNRPQMTFAINHISIGKGQPDWGADAEKEYYILHLGRRLQ